MLIPTVRRRAAALAIAACACAPVHGQFNYTTFPIPPNPSGLNLVGNTIISSVTNPGRLRLTTNTGNQIGAAWYPTRQSVAQGFTTTFTFQISLSSGGGAPNGADGFAFVIQNASASAITGSGGGCTIGYDGIANSVVVEFDTFTTGGVCVGTGNVNDPNGNHISVHTQGTAPNTVKESASIGIFSPAASMETGTHTVRVDYTPGSLSVYYDDLFTPVIVAPINLASTLSLGGPASNSAWLGFTAATGGSFSRHEIISWSFTPVTSPNPAGVGSFTPSPVTAGSAGLLAVAVTLGATAPNAITSVVVDGSSIGGGVGNAISLNDSGTNGDASAGDNIWSRTLAIPIAAATGAKLLPFVVTDVQNRTGAGNVALTVNPANPGDDRRPDLPIIEEPGTANQVVNASDVHMVTDNMRSPIGAGHRCTDWEVYRTSDNVRVWRATCVTDSALKVHIHLGDGVFEGPYAGRTTMEYNTNYLLRVRHRDDSNDPVSEYSYWASRAFRTDLPTAIFPYQEDDILAFPVPTWKLDGAGGVPGPDVILPAAASLVAGSAAGDMLLSFEGRPGGGGNVMTNPPQLGHHIDVRLTITSGAAPLSIAPSTLTVADHHCNRRAIFLPAISLAAGGKVYFWVSSSGSTYVGAATDAAPVFTTLARGTQTPWEVRQPGYVVEQFSTDFQLPVNIAFVPNPGPAANDVFFYVTELYGQIRVVMRNGTQSIYAQNMLNYNPTGIFPGSGESGVAGIVVEPVTGDLFVTLLNATVNGGTALRPRVIRMRSTDGGRTVASTEVLEIFPNDPQGQSHQISNITIGPDNKLYVHSGDGFDQTKGRDLRFVRGKILRMEFDGEPCADNPFFSAVSGLGSPVLTTTNPARETRYVWAYGLRNPFGGAWRASDGLHFIIDNGPSIDRIAVTVPARDYLYTGSDTSMDNYNVIGTLGGTGPRAWDPAHGPVNIAFIQTATFNGSGFPPAKMDRGYVTESGPTFAQGPQVLGKRIVEFRFAPATGAWVSGPAPLVEYTGSGYATCVAIAPGPDGLYFSDLYKDLNTTTPINPVIRGASIWRVRYVGVTGTCPACAADFDGVNGLGVPDIFAFLTAWFGGDPRADFNGIGGITVQDIFAFLTAWFEGC